MAFAGCLCFHLDILIAIDYLCSGISNILHSRFVAGSVSHADIFSLVY